MPPGPDRQERRCIKCGKKFMYREKRYNRVPYRGEYCEEHDAVQAQRGQQDADSDSQSQHDSRSE